MQLYVKKALQSYQVDEGAVITLNYNETLDSAVVKISNLTTTLNLTPYDEVTLSDDRFGDIYMCVDTYTESLVCLSPKKYNYEIHLFSQTKLLEGIVLPNLTITQVEQLYSKRSLRYWLQEILREYGKYKRIYDVNSNPQVQWKPDWHLDTEEFGVSNLRWTKDCPEFQWNMPTLREVLTDLMMVNDCIPVLRNGTIGCIDLTKTKKEVTNFNYVNKSQSSADYVSELQMDMVNVLQTQVDGVNNIVNVAECLPFTCDEAIVTTDNVLVKTQYPILRIKKLVFRFLYDLPITQGEYQGRTRTYCGIIDLSDAVYERKEYDTLPISYNQGVAQPYGTHQNNSVYFNRYSNEILGWARLSKEYYLFNVSFVSQIIEDYIYNTNGIISDAGDPIRAGFFEIDYETIADQMFRAGKKYYSENDRVVVDNQTNSFVDCYNQANMEYQKANRLGNQQIMINSRFADSYTDLTDIGDTFEDSIVYQVQYQIYNHHIEVNSLATKGYILRNYFTGIKSKVRSWINAKDEALTRHDLFKFYCEFSKYKKDEILSHPVYTLNYATPLYFLNNLNITSAEPILYGFAKTHVNSTYCPDYATINEQTFIRDTVCRLMGNSLVFTIGYDDSWFIGSYNIAYDSNLKGLKRGFYRYVDNIGECNAGTIYLTAEYDVTEGDFVFPDESGVLDDGHGSTPGTIYTESRDVIWKKPLIGEDGYYPYRKIELSHTLHKDNREIPRYSIQFEFCADTEDIIFTRKFAESQNAIRTKTTTSVVAKVGSASNFPNDSDAIENNYLVSPYYINDGTAMLQVSPITDASDKAVYIYIDGELALGWKGTDTIYLNLLFSRNPYIYDYDNNQVGWIIENE